MTISNSNSNNNSFFFTITNCYYVYLETIADAEPPAPLQQQFRPRGNPLSNSLFHPPMSENNAVIERYFNSLQHGNSIQEIKKRQSSTNDMKLSLVDENFSMAAENFNTNHFSAGNGHGKKHLSSTGSSMNASPTSQSSLDSSNVQHASKKQLNEFLQQSNGSSNKIYSGDQLVCWNEFVLPPDKEQKKTRVLGVTQAHTQLWKLVIVSIID